MAQAVCELMWVYQLLSEVGFKVSTPAKLWCDNQAAIHIASNPVFHERTKHIEVDCHFVRNKVTDKRICTPFTPSKDQVVDMFTKALNKVDFTILSNKLHTIGIYAPA